MSEPTELQALCRSVLRTCSGPFRDRDVTAEFFPYIGLTHTIRRRGSGWVIRISDHCRNAPQDVLESVILLLACKILRRKPPDRALHVYDRFRQLPEIVRQVQERRLRRGRKQIEDAQGRHHSLDAIYRELNAAYFNNQVDIRRLGWGARKSWGRLGHYDPTHHTITISPVLDSPKVPKAVVSYLLYHEMLHTLFDASAGRTRKRHHTPAFNRAERAFPRYEAVKKFLDRFCRTRGRAA